MSLPSPLRARLQAQPKGEPGKSEIKVFEALEGLRDLVGTSGRENQDSIAATLAIHFKSK